MDVKLDLDLGSGRLPDYCCPMQWEARRIRI